MWEVIADAQGGTGALGHGYTYSGHPVSAAVALEVIRLYTEEGIFENGVRMGELLQSELRRRFTNHPAGRRHPRAAACSPASNWCPTSTPRAPLPASNWTSSNTIGGIGYRNGLIFRAFGDGTIGLAPPLVCTESDIAQLIDRLATTLDDALALPALRGALAA